MAYLDSFAHKEAYSNQVEIPGIASIIHEDILNQATYGNHCELSATTILAVYNDVTNSKGMVKIGTRVSDFCIEWGTAVEFYNGTVEYIIPVRVSDTKFAIVYSHASDHDGYVIAGTVSGTVPTLGTELEFANNTTCINIGTVLMDNDKIMIAYQDATVSQSVIIASFSGILISLGLAVSVNTTIDSASYTTLTQLCKHSTTLATLVYRVSATVTECKCLSLSGTVITAQTAGKSAFGGSADIRYPSIGALSATSFVLAYTDVTDTNKGNAQIGNISGTTITAGASEYAFQVQSNAIRKPIIAIISSTLFAMSCDYDTVDWGLTFVIGSVASTVISFGTKIDVSSTNTEYMYPGKLSGTTINITYTKSGQLTFSYMQGNINQFICGMLSQNYKNIEFTPMCVKVATAGAGEQIEISSVYLKSNCNGFKMTASLETDVASALYFNGTLASSKFYSTSDTSNLVVTSTTLAESKRLLLANNPIILTAGQSLYASIDASQSTSSKKGSCTVFGLKRSV